MDHGRTSDSRHQVVRLTVDPHSQTFYVRFWFIADLLVATVVVAFWVMLLFWAARHAELFRPPKPDSLKVVAGVGAILLAGIAAFVLRLWARRIYGMAEVIFALVVAWSTLSASVPLGAFQSVVALASAVYLVVRGLDNWLQGVEAHDRDGK